jgi:hypothetical protein
MTAADDNSHFIRAAQSQGMLTEKIAAELLATTDDTDAVATLALKRGLMDARQVDMNQNAGF